MSELKKPKSNASTSEDSIDIGYLIGQIIDNKKFIIIIVVIALCFGYLIGKLSTPIYRADALVQIERKPSAVPGMEMAGLFRGTNETEAETFILKSRMIAEPVVHRLNLHKRVEPVYMPVIGELLAKLSGGQDRVVLDVFESNRTGIFKLNILPSERFRLTQGDTVVIEGTVGELVENNGVKIQIGSLSTNNTETFRISVGNLDNAVRRLSSSIRAIEQGTRTGVLEVSIQNPNKVQAENILNAILEEYELQNIRRSAAQAENSLVFLEEQMPGVKATLERAEKTLNDYRINAESVDLATETQSLLERVIELDKQLNQLEIEESEISRLFTLEHPKYQALIEQRKRLIEERNELTNQVQQLPETQQKILRLTRDVEVSQQIYLQLLNRIQELNIAKASTVGNVRVLDHAVASSTPVAPQKALIMAISFLLSLFGSIVFILIKAALNRGIERAEQLEEEGVAVYASIPMSDAQANFDLTLEKSSAARRKGVSVRMPLLAVDDPTDLAIESLRSLRTSLHFAMMEATNKTLMISGPSPSVGKTFITANLATVLAQSGKSVVVIDGDIRRGYMHNIFNLDNKYGLADFLADNESLELCLDKARRDVTQANLTFIPRGTSAPNPSELLMRDRMKELLELLNKQYDYVIVDTPPVLAVTDAAVVGQYAGTTLLVARFGKTVVKEVTQTIQRLAQSNIDVKGVILNGIERKASAYYGYGYSYGYQYGYSYKSEKS